MNTTLRNPFTRIGCRAVAPLLVPFSDGRLTGAARTRVERHLSHCAFCREEVATIAQVGTLLRTQTAPLDTPLPGTSPDLWSGIQAEILRTRGPETTNSRRPFGDVRRWGGPFRFDASWPNGIPVAVAAFSVVVFASVLVEHGHPFPLSHLKPSVNDGGSIAIVIRPSASVASLTAKIAPVERALASAAAPRPLRASVAATPRHEAASMAIASSRTSRIAVALPAAAVSLMPSHPVPVVPTASVAVRRITHTVPAGKPTMVAFVSRPAKVAAETETTDSPSAAKVDTAVAAGLPGASADSLDRPHVDSSAVATVSAANNTALGLSASAVDALSEDATVREDTPAAEPMVDLTAFSRRQRSLFSYASR